MILAPAILALAAPLAVRVMAAIGIGWVTYTGVDLILTQVTQAIVGQIGGMPTAAAQLAAKMGLFDAIGIGLGALTTRLSLQTMSRLVKL